MSYSYAKRSFPRRRRPMGGGNAGWMAALVLAVAIGGLWWAQNEPLSENFPEDTTIIPSSDMFNNPEDATMATDTEENKDAVMTLHLEGFTIWGVQKGIYGTQQAAQEAAGEKELLFEAEDGYRVIESVWGEREQAKAREAALSSDSYAAELSAEGLNLKLTGSSEKLAAVESGVRAWEGALKELLEVQNLLETGSVSQATAKRYAAVLRDVLADAGEAIPEETQVLIQMKEALENTERTLEEIVEAKAEEEVDFVEIFRYNVGISHNIYKDYLSALLSSS